MTARLELGLKRESAIHLASFLVTNGLITEEQVAQAVTASNESNRGLMETILESELIDEDEIATSIGEMYNLDLVRLRRDEDVSIETLKLLPAPFIQQNRIVPFEESSGMIKVAISEPDSLNTVPSVRTITNKKVTAYIITFSDMQSLLSRLDPTPTHTKKTPSLRSVRQPTESSVAAGKVLSKTPDKDSLDNDARLSSEVVKLVDKILNEAMSLGVSDVHIEPYKTFSRVRYRKDGVLQDEERFSKSLEKNYAAVTTRIKIMSTLDIAERRLPQDGSFTTKGDGKEIDVRVSILPTSLGERVVMRLLDGSSAKLSIERMGLQETDESALKDAVDSPQGLTLVTGPTGSGKSTTLYAVLNRLNRVGVNILTVEDPVEYTLEGVGQVQVKDEIGLSFSAVLRSFLRQDPEIIMVGEIRDKETADIAIKAALTGHLVLSTIHTNDSVSTITRLLNMGIPSYLISSSLRVIVAQRLARKICDSCREIDETVSIDDYLAIGFTAEESSRSKLYRGAGCSRCDGSGCSGRRGIFEVLRITDSIREGILKQLTTLELLTIAKEKDGFTTLQKMGRALMLQGEISAEEFRRVLLAV